ncbi:acetylornithine and succinylornithine aminotransferase [Capsaspora owczarzaki ATCC 30864]|uniref:acetylornithine transaminase n=1 Tax=Capsaspora owczarzaki (strain ATCC 30864) TaxID=595528 RepID=A0A0D2VY77_CAPO3|nr:acetylornithine and succinylornithine aminotransferase [Capsaspora owczarzaki ATCC 30864]KJE96637.1 acetylornithine and succinylornithine aminotransferase [Capsaspora owczarzaki ATCC 30864]|eukprot:XP_004344556.1 acetylornithine and succinylornithine aminotransferase [Capsaspora owczarzaki ATCC 30864]
MFAAARLAGRASSVAVAAAIAAPRQVATRALASNAAAATAVAAAQAQSQTQAQASSSSATQTNKSILPPVPEMVAMYKKYLMNTYDRPDVVFVRGEGLSLFDSAGQEYLDFYAGIAVTALGHNNPIVNRALAEAQPLLHLGNLFHSAPAIFLAKELVTSTAWADKAFFCNSGTEANEGALKFARKWGNTADPSLNKNQIVAFKGGFHGRTMGSLSATHNPAYQAAFQPLIPNNLVGTFNDLQSASDLVSDRTCAVIVEPIQGEGGVYPATAEFLAHLRKLCDQHNALLIFDEIQCGVGRTGHLWAHSAPQFNGVQPDIMTLAKPLANGLPVGAILVRDRVSELIKPGDHGTTFGGGPGVCNVARAVLGEVQQLLPKMQTNIKRFDEILESLRQQFPKVVLDVRGIGFLRGVELTAEYTAKQVQQEALRHGIVMITAGKNVLRLTPPLIVGEPQLERLRTALTSIFKSIKPAA